MTRKFNSLESNELYEQTVNFKFGYWVIPKTCFEESIDLDFEDDKFECPANYDEYLTKVYGNYMELPPEEKRAKGHNIIQVEFNEGKPNESDVEGGAQ